MSTNAQVDAALATFHPATGGAAAAAASISHNWQHSPSEIQVARTPVKAVSKSLQQTKPSVFSVEDLMGLSWILFEERH
jgi:hypothetical protein